MHVHAADQSFIAAAAIWTAMMAVMMAPTVAPWIRAHYRLGLAGRGGIAPTATFAAGYFAIWSVFGAVLALLSRSMAVPGRGVVTVVLVAAGAFQFTPLKQSCLRHCRNPLTFLLTRWRDGSAAAFGLGARHGIHCLGCCWALMLTTVALGVMNLGWMAAVTAVAFVEQVAPWGARLRVPLGLTLAACACGFWLMS